MVKTDWQRNLSKPSLGNVWLGRPNFIRYAQFDGQER